MKQRVILHNIRSAHNVGSIFRTADGAGVEHVYISGYTPQPQDRFGRIQPEIAKTSLGASEILPWSAISDLSAELRRLQQNGWTVIAVEQSPDSVALHALPLPEHAVFIFGNEIEGLEQEILEAADQVVEIPMYGTKESLNVSVAAGIVLFHTSN